MAYKAVVKREIIRLYNNPVGLISSFILPLILCMLICFIFSKASPQDLPIGVFNADNSKLSRTFVRNLNTLRSCKVKYQLTSLEEGKNLLVEGKIYGIIVIPKNFQRDMIRMQSPKLVFYYNNQRILIGGVISKDIRQMIFSMLIGIDAKIKNQKGIPYKTAIKQSNLINIVDHTRSNPYFNYLYLLALTAFGHLLQIAMVMTSVWSIGTEFKFGTTKEWLKEADNSIIIAFLGKVTPYFLIFIFLFTLIYFIYFVLFQVPYSGSFLAGILATIIFIITCLSLGSLFMSINGNFRYCLSASVFYVAIGFALAGITFPVMSMPLVIRMYTSIMPLNYWVQIMIDQSLRSIPYIHDLRFFIPSLGITLIALLSLYRLKKLALDKKRWFQE